MQVKRLSLVLIAVAGCSTPPQTPQGETDSTTGSSGEESGAESESSSTGEEPAPPACGTEIEGWEAGTRLRPRVLRPADGVGTLVAWHDTVLDADCDFAIAADGVMRCLPLGVETYGEYLDADCTTPRAAGSSAEGTDYLRANLCGGTAVYEAGVFHENDYENPHEAEFRVLDGECVGFRGGGHYDAGPLVPASTFAAATVVEAVVDGPLQRRYVEAEDGACARLPSSMPEFNLPAGASTAADDVVRFLPQFGNEFRDYAFLSDSQDCDERRVAESCEAGSVIFQFRSEDDPEPACRVSRRHIHEVGADFGDAPAYTGPECEPTPMPTELAMHRYLVGPEIPAESFPEAIQSWSEGPQRLQVVTHRLADETHTEPTSTHWDTELEASCSAETLADGLRYCVPEVSTEIVYADPECREARAVITGWLSHPETCEIDRWGIDRIHETEEHEAYQVVYRVGEEDRSGPDLYALLINGCQPFRRTAPDDRVWHTSGPLSPDTFVLLPDPAVE